MFSNNNLFVLFKILTFHLREWKISDIFFYYINQFTKTLNMKIVVIGYDDKFRRKLIIDMAVKMQIIKPLKTIEEPEKTEATIKELKNN